MRKSTLFISAALTTFILAVLFGVISGYKKDVVDNPQATTDVAMVNTEASFPTPAESLIITPEQAAALASQVLGRTDLYSVETSVFSGQSAYLVTFSSGDLVYVSPQGTILSVTTAPVVVYSAPAAPTNNKNRKPPQSGGGGEGEGEGGEHEGGEN